MALPKVISLFSGAGGLDHGFVSVGFELAFAVDSSEWAVRTHKQNFPGSRAVTADLTELGSAGVLEQIADVLQPGEAVGVIGGPPCQGFSRANTLADAADPRNQLPLLYLEIVEALQRIYDVQFVLFENVLGIRDVKHADSFLGILERFRELKLHELVQEHSALDYGVPQNRRRVIISGFKSLAAAEAFAPIKVPRGDLSVRSAIGGLPEPAFFARSLTAESVPFHPNHWTMRPISKRFADPSTLNATGRSFKRLDWDKPSPTVAYGHREIHVHPEGTRRLSIFEAMRLQGFPQEFVLIGPLSAQVDQVSNAVPPPLAKALATAMANAIATQPAELRHDRVA